MKWYRKRTGQRDLTVQVQVRDEPSSDGGLDLGLCLVDEVFQRLEGVQFVFFSVEGFQIIHIILLSVVDYCFECIHAVLALIHVEVRLDFQLDHIHHLGSMNRPVTRTDFSPDRH